MSDAMIEGYARALFEVARAEGTLDEVEDELFRFARSYESSDALRNALTDEHIPAEKRQAIVEDLLGSKTTTTTVQLVSMVVGSGRARDARDRARELLERTRVLRRGDVLVLVEVGDREVERDLPGREAARGLSRRLRHVEVDRDGDAPQELVVGARVDVDLRALHGLRDLRAHEQAGWQPLRGLVAEVR